MFFIDIDVPRDGDPAMNSVEGIFVYSIDDLQSVAAANISDRQKEAQDAEAIIRKEVQRYEDRQHTLDGVPAIVALQETLESLRQSELQRSNARLASLSAEQRQAVEVLTRSLVNKMQHAPIQAIKRAAREGDRETLAVIQNLFDASYLHRAANPENETSSAENLDIEECTSDLAGVFDLKKDEPA